MNRLSCALVALAFTIAGAASAETVRIEGTYTTETHYANPNTQNFAITPIPFSLDLHLVPDPGAPVFGDGDSASVWSEQTHALQETHSTQFSEPHPLTVPTMQRLQQWQDRPFNAAVFAGYADPRYDATIATMSKNTVFGFFPVEGVSSWSFEVRQQWSNGVNANIEEQWATVFNVRLTRPLDPEGDPDAPWTAGDLTSFLDGFEEAGGTVHVINEARFTQFAGGRVDRTVGLSGDFHIASVTQPIPEPSSVALLVVGLGCIAWRVRSRSAGRGT
jgi:hypothetical protein